MRVLWQGSLLLAIGLWAVGPLCPAQAGDARGGYGASQDPTWGEWFAAPFKRIGHAFAPASKSTPEVDSNDPTTLKSKSAPGPELRLALAGGYEQKGNLADAEQQYELALKAAPKDTRVLCAFARLRIRQGQLDEARKLYDRALKIAPDDPLVLNDVALCQARQGKWAEALQNFKRCVQLQPQNVLYRNNFAAALVETGQVDEALEQFRAVHTEATAHYNLGYLLTKKGQQHRAAEHFAVAANLDPSLDQARYWLARLESGPEGRPAVPPQIAARPAAVPTPARALEPEARPVPVPDTAPVMPPPEPAPATVARSASEESLAPVPVVMRPPEPAPQVAPPPETPSPVARDLQVLKPWFAPHAPVMVPPARGEVSEGWTSATRSRSFRDVAPVDEAVASQGPAGVPSVSTGDPAASPAEIPRLAMRPRPLPPVESPTRTTRLPATAADAPPPAPLPTVQPLPPVQ